MLCVLHFILPSVRFLLVISFLFCFVRNDTFLNCDIIFHISIWTLSCNFGIFRARISSFIECQFWRSHKTKNKNSRKKEVMILKISEKLFAELQPLL